MIAAALGLPGCGGDDEDETAARAPAPTAPAKTAPAPKEAPADTGEGSGGQPAPPEPAREKEPGGQGDEEPSRSEARLALLNGELSPREVKVAPYIAIELAVGGQSRRQRIEISVIGEGRAAGAEGRGAVTLMLEGLRPGRRYKVTEVRSGATATIVASDETGP